MSLEAGLVIGFLLLSNIATILWSLKTRVPLRMSKQVRALQAAIASFEIERHAILRIERIPPDSVFLRSPLERE